MKCLKEMLKFFHKFCKTYKIHIFIYFIIDLSIALITVLLPVFNGRIVNALVDQKSFDKFWPIILVYFGLCLCLIIFNVVISYVYVKLQTSISYLINKFFLSKIYNTPYTYLKSNDLVYISQIIYSDTDVIVSFSLRAIINTFVNIISCIWIFSIVLNYSYLLMGLMILLFVLYVIIYCILKTRIYKADLSVKEAQGKYYSQLNNMIVNCKSVILNFFNLFEFSVLNKKYNNLHKSYLKKLNIDNTYLLSLQGLALCIRLITYIIGGILVINGKINMGIFITLTNYFTEMLSSVDYFLNLGPEYQSAKVSYNRLMDIEILPEINYGNKKIAKITDIVMKNVEFTFNEGKPLFHINYNFKANYLYWIKGENGTGKSTLVNLLLGLFGNNYCGQIKINSIDIQEIDKNDLLENKVVIVEQNPFIIEDSVLNNMTAKCKTYNKSFLEYLIDGFELKTLISEDRKILKNLSNGEKQKVVIIRAFLSNATLLVFDEPTSSLDERSCMFFYKVIKQFSEEKIIIIISHVDIPYYDAIIDLNRDGEKI